LKTLFIITLVAPVDTYETIHLGVVNILETRCCHILLRQQAPV